MNKNFNTDQWLRDNIRSLKPYSSARDEFTGEAMVFLDANENPFDTGYNRYPDPGQQKLKQQIAAYFQVSPDQLFVGNGSDEAIDLLIRASCEARQDKIAAISPSYGMYRVCADIQGVETDEVLLDDDFSLNAERVLRSVGKHHKLIFLCSPNNPTGNILDTWSIRKVLDGFQGVVVVDEAYMDFSDEESNIRLLTEYPNLVVLRTFSKAWGMAGVRCGLAFGGEEVIRAISKIKYPYNMNQLTQQVIAERIAQSEEVAEQLCVIRSQRKRLSEELSALGGVLMVHASEANFILIRVQNPEYIYHELIKSGIVVRDRSRQNLCEGCLRITVGTKDENDQLMAHMKQLLS